MKTYSKILFLLIALLSTGCMTVATSGEYTLESGRTLRGDFIMTSGEATLKEGSRVTGNVIMTSGTLNVDGQVDGDILFSSAKSINLGPKSVVTGDIRGASGDIFQAEGSQVGGQIANSETFTFGTAFFAKALGILCGIPLALIFSAVYWVSSRRKMKSEPDLQQVDSRKDGPTAQLKQLKQMMEEGLINEADYETKKADVLAKL